MTGLSVGDRFDSGAIEVVSAQAPEDIRVNIRRDSNADFTQWFHFRVRGVAGRRCQVRFLNAGRCTYPKGWDGYNVVASYDRSNWFRVPTTFDGNEMVLTHTPDRDSVYYAYFEPYSWERHLDFLGAAEASGLAHVSRLGRTLEGRDLDCIELGNPGAGRTVWVIARQHPGETMAEWFVEGLARRLMDESDAVSRAVRELASIRLVPNMNPDGSVAGNLRTNAAGANLNREWAVPSEDRSPEVWCVRRAIQYRRHRSRRCPSPALPRRRQCALGNL